MNKLTTIIIFLLAPTLTDASEYKYGLDVYRSSSDIACKDVRSVINHLWGTSCEDESTGYRVSYTIDLIPTYYLELAYTDFGEVQRRGEFTGFEGEEKPSAISQETVSFGASGLEVIARKDIALIQSLNLNLYAGAAYIKGIKAKISHFSPVKKPS